MALEYRIVDRVERETADLLSGTDAILAHGEEETFVLEEVEDNGSQ